VIAEASRRGVDMVERKKVAEKIWWMIGLL